MAYGYLRTAPRPASSPTYSGPANNNSRPSSSAANENYRAPDHSARDAAMRRANYHAAAAAKLAEGLPLGALNGISPSRLPYLLPFWFQPQFGPFDLLGRVTAPPSGWVGGSVCYNQGGPKAYIAWGSNCSSAWFYSGNAPDQFPPVDPNAGRVLELAWSQWWVAGRQHMYYQNRTLVPGASGQKWYSKHPLYISPLLPGARPFPVESVPRPVDPLSSPVFAPEGAPWVYPHRALPYRRANPLRAPGERTEFPRPVGPAPRPPSSPPAVEYVPGGPTRPLAKGHVNKPPGKRTKEAKFALRGLKAGTLAARVLSGVTEAVEVVDAAFNCLPKDIRKKAFEANNVKRTKKEYVDNPLKDSGLPEWMRGKDKIRVDADNYDRSGYNKPWDGNRGLSPQAKLQAIYDFMPHNQDGTKERNYGKFLECLGTKLVENNIEDLVLGKIGQQAAKSSRKLGLPTGVQTGPTL